MTVSSVPRKRIPRDRDNDYYVSITIPSLIVATYGGGTGLATQRECLEMLGCYGAGKVLKLAETVAATVFAASSRSARRSSPRSGSGRTTRSGATAHRYRPAPWPPPP